MKIGQLLILVIGGVTFLTLLLSSVSGLMAEKGLADSMLPVYLCCILVFFYTLKVLVDLVFKVLSEKLS